MEIYPVDNSLLMGDLAEGCRNNWGKRSMISNYFPESLESWHKNTKYLYDCPNHMII